MALAEAYIDESWRKIDGGRRLLCVAGYVFRRQKAREFHKAWTPFLTKKMGYPYCHMADLVHRTDIFKGAKREDTDAIQRRLVLETRKWSAFGFAVTVDEDAYRQLVGGQHTITRSAYAFALLQAMIMVGRWADRADFHGQISYFFEQNDEWQPEANRFLDRMLKGERAKARYRYQSHSWSPKETPWLHSADMLAWEWSLETQRSFEVSRRPTRESLKAVLRPHDMVMDYGQQNLAQLRREMDERYGTVVADLVGGDSG